MDVWSEQEANVVAVVRGAKWQSAAEYGVEPLKRVVASKPAYVLLPSVTAETTASGKGELSGTVREECYELYVGLAAPAPAHGFAALNTAGLVRAVPLQDSPVEPAYRAAVARIIQAAAGVKVDPAINHAYRVDLDGNGKPETLLEATHPDLAGDPPEYKPDYYSLVVVLPDSSGTDPAYTGYLQAAKDLSQFEVLTIDAVADVDLDGTRELLVRARHAEGWQTQVFRYRQGLHELFRSVGGEGECPGTSE